MKTTPSTLLLIATVALALSSAPAWATPNIINEANTLENYTGRTDPTNIGSHNVGSPGSPLPDTYSYAGPILTLNLSAQYGLLHSGVFVDPVSGSGTFENGQAFTAMRWDDFATISAPGLSGQAGTLTVGLLYSASVQRVGTENWLAAFYLRAANQETSVGYSSNGSLPVSANNVPLTLSVPFTFGVPFNIGAGISNNAGSNSSSNGSAPTFYHGDLTAQWNGAAFSVVDGSSAAVTNFTVTSQSGFNYAQAVPEPSSWMVTVSGAGLLLGLRRSRRRWA